jgi:hypothetical protein
MTEGAVSEVIVAVERVADPAPIVTELKVPVPPVMVAFAVAKLANVAFPVMMFALSAFIAAKEVVPRLREVACSVPTFRDVMFAASKFAYPSDIFAVAMLMVE